MAGISHLQEIFKKKGKDFINRLFDSYVTVNEKLDASAFGIEKDPVSGAVLYYKRNTDAPISKIDRTLMRYYETPISHFDGLSEEVKTKIPPGWRFGFEYFVNHQPQYIAYDRVPKNNLVLSYIHVKNGLGDVVRTVQDKQSLDEWADLLDVERSPIIFQGKLSDDQKVAIMEYMDTPAANLTSKHKTNSFVKFVISVLNPSMKKTTLNEDLDKSIEGVVFRFGELSEDGPVMLAKIVDPVFEALAKEKPAAEEDRTGDMYYILLMDLANFIESIRMKSIRVKGKTFDDRYINFISEVFNRFIDEFGDKYEDFRMDEPAYLKKKEFELNDRFIDNPVTIANIESSENFRKIFKVMLAAFRKRKKRAVSIFTKEVIEQFNGTVLKIASYLSQGLLAESESMPTFGEFLSMKGRPTIETDEPGHVEYNDPDNDPDILSKLGTIVKDQPEPGKPEKKGASISKKVNIIVGRFQPFHNGHLSMARDMFEANKQPCMFIVVNTGKQTEQSPFTQKTVEAYMDNIVAENSKMVEGFVVVRRGFIDDIIQALRPKYEPILWGVGDDRIDDYQKQIELNYRKGNPLKLTEKFLIMQTKRVMNATDIRKDIKANDFTKVKESVPKGVQLVWPLLREDILKINREKSPLS